MAIINEFQRKGIGTKLFSFTFKIFSSKIPDGIGLWKFKKIMCKKLVKMRLEKEELNFIKIQVVNV